MNTLNTPKIRMMGNQALAAQLLSCKIGQKISKARRLCKRTLVFPTSYQKADAKWNLS